MGANNYTTLLAVVNAARFINPTFGPAGSVACIHVPRRVSVKQACRKDAFERVSTENDHSFDQTSVRICAGALCYQTVA